MLVQDTRSRGGLQVPRQPGSPGYSRGGIAFPGMCRQSSSSVRLQSTHRCACAQNYLKQRRDAAWRVQGAAEEPRRSVWEAVPIARAGLLVLMVAFLHLHKVYPWQLVPAVLASVVLCATIESPWVGVVLPSAAIIMLPLPFPFSPQMPPGRVVLGMQGWALLLGLSVPWIWASGRKHHSGGSRSLGTETWLAGRREMLKVMQH